MLRFVRILYGRIMSLNNASSGSRDNTPAFHFNSNKSPAHPKTSRALSIALN